MSGNYGSGSGAVSEDGILFNSTAEKIGTLIAVLQEDGSWVFYDGQGQVFTPDFLGGEYIEWEVASIQMPNVNVDPEVQCFLRDKVLDEPTNMAASVSGKGYIDKYLYTSAQFPNEGNLGSSDSGFHSLVLFDTDGVPSINGEVLNSNITTIVQNETTAYGGLTVWEGNIFYPTRYPDTAAGKYVSSAKLVNTYASTTYPDFEWFAIASNNGQYSLDREDLNVVLNGSSSGSRDIFELDPSQKGQWARFGYANGDKGNHSQTNIQMELTYEDGSSATIALTNFIHKAGVISGHSIKEQEVLQYNTTTQVWSINGSEVSGIVAGARNMSIMPCSRQPITFNAYIGSTSVSFSAVFGGNNDSSGFQYSIDAGRNWQSSGSFALSGNSREILPMVKDSDGQVSCVKNISEYINCSSGSWSADLITPNNNDTSFDDGAGDRGFNVEYSQEVGGTHLEENDRELTWSFDAAEHAQSNVSYGYIGYQAATPSGKLVAELSPILAVAESGQTYTIAENIYNYYTGSIGEDVDFSAKVIDMVTGNTLGQKNISWAGNTTATLNNDTFSFVGAGNPARIEIEISQPPTTADWWSTAAALSLVSTTATSALKTGGTGWNSAIRSGKGRRPNQPSGVYAEFKTTGSGNKGMHGLDSDYEVTGVSYVGEYMFYISSNTAYHIYENGSSKKTGVSNLNSVYKIQINSVGLVEYLINDAVVYTSATTADVNDQYFIHSSAYTTNTGIDSIVHNMTDNVVMTDYASHYLRIDNLRLFKGRYSDASHHAKIVGNDIFFRNVEGVAVATFDPHLFADRATIRPQLNLVKYGTHTQEHKAVFSYKINNGSWIEMLNHEGDFDVANKIYLSPFTYGKNIDVQAGDTLSYKVEIHGDGVGNSGFYLRGISDGVVC